MKLPTGIIVFGWMAGCVPGAFALAPSAPASRVTMAESVRSVSSSPADASAPRLVRSTLTAGETAAPMEFEIVLKLRNQAELESRVAQGQIISFPEMAEKYFPTESDYETVKAWLSTQGLALTAEHQHHLAVFAHGSVGRVRDAFHVSFGRVAYRGAEYTSALTAPQLPADLAPLLVGVNGLQPHLHAYPPPQPNNLTGNSPPYTPTQLAKAYNANGLTQTGAGQIIAIVGGAFPQASDLSAFWSQVGITPTHTAITQLAVSGGPSSASTAGDLAEATLDVEWASTLAPGASIWVFGAPASFDPAYAQIISDQPGNPTLRQVSISYGNREIDLPVSQLETEQQYFLTMAGLGITVFASSGDGGSRPDVAGRTYTPSNPLSVGGPASNPYVTAVGGTTLVTDTTTGLETSETGWSASGGGVSGFYARPGWQSGTGIAAGNMRLVPDVALAANPTEGAYQVLNGSSSLQGGGTSWAAPSWAAFCALINQACATAGQPPVGLLGPKIYPLIGSTAFRDITSGSNGDFSAGVGYDEVTGIGVPNVTLLMQALLGTPSFTTPPTDQEVTVGANATFSVVATANPAVTSYHWQRLPAGFSAWTSLSDNGTYSGSATSVLVVGGTTLAMSGDQFQCIVSNGTHSTSSIPVTLLVKNPLIVTTLAGLAGTTGVTDGPEASARFATIFGAVTDSAGNVYLADFGYSDVRKITVATGLVSTVAGSPGVTGTTDAVGSAARFGNPWGLALDSAGNLYVADYANHNIRKIAPNGTVTTWAGQAGVPGTADGSGTAAQFNHPSGLAMDSSGNLYVADQGNNTIRKITPAGVVSTFAGTAGMIGLTDGTGTAAQFAGPQGVAVDNLGNVYVADTGNHTIRKITTAGVVTTLAGFAGTNGTTDGAGYLAKFYFPSSLVVDASGNIYITDTYNDLIRAINPQGLATTIAGAAGVAGSSDGTGSAAMFSKPQAITFDHSGNFYIGDTNNDTVRKATLLTAASSSSGSAPSVTLEPTSQTVASGSTVVFAVAAGGSPTPTYQWEVGGVPISGATSSRLVLSGSAVVAGTYTCVISNSDGVVVSNPAVLSTTTTANPGRLVNLSMLSDINGSLSMGFVIGGTGTSGNETLLIRAVGPSIGPGTVFNVGNVMFDPTLTVVQQTNNAISFKNAGWAATSTNQAAVTGADNATGAFPLTVTTSLDSALVESLPSVGGGYSATVAGASGDSGNALTEVYDDTSTYTPASTRLLNLSCLTNIPAGNTIDVGFVIGGTTAKTLFIRASGPTLAVAPFNIGGAMADPQVIVSPSANTSNVISANAGWGGDPVLSATAASIGAFAFASTTSKDSATVVTLEPNVPYAVQVNSASGEGGEVLVEIYEVP